MGRTMAYGSFAAELTDKADKAPGIWIHDVQEHDGKTLVEHVGADDLIRGICSAHDLRLLGELTGEDAAEAGAEDGAKITALE